MVQTAYRRDQPPLTEPGRLQVLLPISALPQVYHALSPCAPDEFSGAGVRAECVACGIRLDCEELKTLAEEHPPNEKLQRLRLEYCARRTCDSRFYRITVTRDSPALRSALESLATPLPRTFERSNVRLISGLNSAQWLKAAACGAALLYLLFVFHHLYYGERVPLWQKPHHYRTIPGPSLPLP